MVKARGGMCEKAKKRAGKAVGTDVKRWESGEEKEREHGGKYQGDSA